MTMYAFTRPLQRYLVKFPLIPLSKINGQVTLASRYAEITRKTVPGSERQLGRNTTNDQNPHLKHAVSFEGGKEGRKIMGGNTELPSLQLKKWEIGRGRGNKDGPSRRLHTSAVLQVETSDEGDPRSSKETSHTSETYFKDVDTTPALSSKTHTVDAASDVAHRPNEQYANPDVEYATVSRERPFELPVGEGEGGLRYGGLGRDLVEDGLAAKGAEGRKP